MITANYKQQTVLPSVQATTLPFFFGS